MIELAAMDPNDHYRNLLQVLHLSQRDHSTSLGQAKTTGVQCRYKVAARSRTCASELLQNVSTIPQTDEDAKHKVEVAAGLLLCKRYHQDQRMSITTSWADNIRTSALMIPVPLQSPTLDETMLESIYSALL